MRERERYRMEEVNALDEKEGRGGKAGFGYRGQQGEGGAMGWMGEGEACPCSRGRFIARIHWAEWNIVFHFSSRLRAQVSYSVPSV